MSAPFALSRSSTTAGMPSAAGIPEDAVRVAALVECEVDEALRHLDGLTGGEPRLRAPLLSRFIDSVNEDIAAMSSAGSPAVPSVTLERLHRLVGAFLGIGALRIAEQCQSLEATLASGDPVPQPARAATEQMVRLFLRRLSATAPPQP